MCKACQGCIRITMMIFNFIFVLCGLGLFAAGLYFYLWTFFKDMGADGSTMVIAFYILMGVGAFTLIVGACGCCGAYHESPCLLGTYFVLLLIIFAAEVAAGVLCIVFRSKVENLFNKTFKKGAMELSKREKPTRHWMDQVQETFKCCGDTGSRVYYVNGKWNLPQSCCNGCKAAQSDNIYTEGCRNAWEKFIRKNWIYVAVVLLAVALIELLGLVFSMCLCCTVRTIEYDMVDTRA